MSKVKTKDTKPELIVRKFLHKNGIRYRLHDKNFVGKPDLVLRSRKMLIFINGCFWHGHAQCKRSTLPKTNTDFWTKKQNYNSEKDRQNYKTLENDGWQVLVIWECQLSKPLRINALQNLITRIKDSNN